MNNNIKFKKITSDEFHKLRGLFSGTDITWNNYCNIRTNKIINEDIDIYVIEYNYEFIGEITVNYKNHYLPTETVENRRVYLEAFRLNKDFQGRGLGQKLIEYVLSDLEKKGYCEFTIGVEDNNEIAKHIYFKCGFTEPIDKFCGNKFDPYDYTLYMKNIKK